MTVYETRRRKLMSLGECARAVGVETHVMSRIECGVVRPDDEVLAKVGAVLGMTLAEVKAGIPSEEESRESYTHMSDMLAALVACKADAKQRGLGRGNGGSGSVECPVCKGTVRYTVASTNGHMWGKCSNPFGCVSWMQ